MVKSQKIGFLGGTFDPFHIGHLCFAIEILEKSDLEEIWISPAYLSPFKIHEPPIDAVHRTEMIKAAIEGIPNLKLIQIESEINSLSYTYEALRKLKKKGGEPVLILSDDLIYGLEKWHQVEKLLGEFELLVGKRESIILQKEKVAPWIWGKIKNKIIPIKRFDVSSSEIRDRLKNKLCCKHLLPLKTLDYIYKYKLYS